jgi:hypothetical protein
MKNDILIDEERIGTLFSDCNPAFLFRTKKYPEDDATLLHHDTPF